MTLEEGLRFLQQAKTNEIKYNVIQQAVKTPYHLGGNNIVIDKIVQLVTLYASGL